MTARGRSAPQRRSGKAAVDAVLEAFIGRDGESADIAARIADIPRVRALLLGAAREGRALTYSEVLLDLGTRFTRPKMRALCRTLDAIDAEGAVRGEPGLAVLVVRQSDALPGQGWWVGRRDYSGMWEGPQALAHVRELQRAVFDYWRGR